MGKIAWILWVIIYQQGIELKLVYYSCFFKFCFITEGTSGFLRCIYVKVYRYNDHFSKPGLVVILL